MVIFVDVDVNEIARLGRKFHWQRPPECPCCGAGLWWHGFVLAYFDHLPQAVWIHRLRCPCCGAVHRLRPKAYWSRFRSTTRNISLTINRFLEQDWQPDIPNPRQKLWWQRFCRKARLVIGLGWEWLPDAFDLLISWGQIPVSNVIQSG